MRGCFFPEYGAPRLERRHAPAPPNTAQQVPSARDLSNGGSGGTPPSVASTSRGGPHLSIEAAANGVGVPFGARAQDRKANAAPHSGDATPSSEPLTTP